ncbi:hypothetical protein [uncultured Porphyromonas sp.]|uniref:hypothetical protein n=1 Tax=uncultured Porphyromonas sp. TaxID=159274 RepID=UPI0026098B93|nr:hypothetical protein [uncultured Porphyromonas sp.]
MSTLSSQLLRCGLFFLCLLFAGSTAVFAQRKKPRVILPDTVYLLDHYARSPHWVRPAPRKKTQVAPRATGAVPPKNYGWEFLAPAWRGVQDSAEFPAFRYHYASPEDYRVKETRDRTPRFIGFYVKEEPEEQTAEWLRSVTFTSMADLETKVDYAMYFTGDLPKTIYIVRVTREAILVYPVFATACKEGDFSVGCRLTASFFLNPESLHPLRDYEARELAEEELERVFETNRRLKRYRHDVPWIRYRTRYRDGLFYE